MKNLFNWTISLVFTLVKHQPLVDLKSTISSHLTNLKAFFSTIVFCVKYFDSIGQFGKNSIVLGKCIIRKERHKQFDLNIGDSVLIHDNSEFRGRGSIVIGTGTSIGYNTLLCCTSKISIGQNVLIADNVKLYTANHKYSEVSVPIKDQGEDQGEIIVEDNVWIGANVVLLKGAVIKSGSIIGSNAVVTGLVPENEIWAGVPARMIKKRF